MSSNKPSIPKGTRDFGPTEMAKRNHIISAIKTQFELFGFSEIQTPSMEHLNVLTGKYGDEGDQLIFKVLNSGDYLKKVDQSQGNLDSKRLLPDISEKGLRYDLTVPFARFVVQNQNSISFPFRRFQIQPVWRADRPQKGRYREFYQCDADIIGTNSIINEVELTQLIHNVFHELNYENFILKVNHRDILFSIAQYVGLESKEIQFATIIDKLDKVPQEKVHNELLELGAEESKLTNYFELTSSNDNANVEVLLTRLNNLLPENKGIKDLTIFFDLLTQVIEKPKVELDFSLARGLSYYTGMIFEVKAKDVNIGSICGGGRYDNLTGVFGLSNISGVGISFGLDRIMDVLEEKNLFPNLLGNEIDVVIGHFDQESLNHGVMVLNSLRRSGIKVFLYPDVVKIKKQMAYANKIAARHTLIIGSEEIAKKRYTLKNMETGDQKEMTISEIISVLKPTQL
ncbi:MAG: histidyl-tRNA synthetase [Cyclobacteriaceae bacterium]|jgi:histidyl-tRNA synthetase